jgi:NADH-quinone oxidoreductase subunit G
MRILPRVNDAVNEEWLADKARYSWDGLGRRRLDRPWVRRDGQLRQATWPEAFATIAARLQGLAGERIGAVAGDLADAESMLALRDLMTALGSRNLDCRQDGAALDASRRDFYLFNPTVVGIEEADAILLIGSNPRREAPVLNARIRKRWALGGCPIAYVGPEADLTYPAQHLGNGPKSLGNLGTFGDVLRDAKRPLVIVGQGALRRPDGAAILAAAWSMAVGMGALTAEWFGFGVLHTAAARVGALDLGFVPGPGGKDFAQMVAGGVDLLWLLGADEFNAASIPSSTFVVYQGSHGDAGAARADVVLPGAAYTEKPGTYVSTEGRAQRAFLAVQPPGEAREDWRILRAFSEVAGQRLPYDTLDALRERLAAASPAFARIGEAPRRGCIDLAGPAAGGVALSDAPFVTGMADYYQTNPISRASPTMAECSSVYGPAPHAAAAE